jgi:hypothetical protein
MYEVTYADRTKGLVGCEKFEVLEGGVIAFYSHLSSLPSHGNKLDILP